MVSKEFVGIIAGEYGKTPAEIDPEFSKKILGDRSRLHADLPICFNRSLTGSAVKFLLI